MLNDMKWDEESVTYGPSSSDEPGSRVGGSNCKSRRKTTDENIKQPRTEALANRYYIVLVRAVYQATSETEAANDLGNITRVLFVPLKQQLSVARIHLIIILSQLRFPPVLPTFFP